MVHLYYGDGKGKTTAALGVALRMAGYGKHVLIVQFLKGSPSGEMYALQNLPNVTLMRGQLDGKFVFQMTAQEKAQTAALHEHQLEQAREAAFVGAAQMIVLDEVIDAIETDTLAEQSLRSFLTDCRDRAEIVLTGHQTLPWLIDASDYITQMRKEKHPFDLGARAREGVEY